MLSTPSYEAGTCHVLNVTVLENGSNYGWMTPPMSHGVQATIQQNASENGSCAGLEFKTEKVLELFWKKSGRP